MLGRSFRTIFGTLALALWAGQVVHAQPTDALPSFQDAARTLQRCVVTVRVALDEEEMAGEPAGAEADVASEVLPGESGAAVRRVTVCSGVALGGGLIVTPIYAGSDSAIRITMPGGKQASAHVRVLDEYTGLALLETQDGSMHRLELSDKAPQVGSWVVSAAAWGVEQPVISLGVVSAVERTLRGASYPPLLQCDLRTTETSSGGAIVDAEGRLLGVIVATDRMDERPGWTYAVSARHVQRLLNARREEPDEASVVVLKRRRPTVGMVLDDNGDGVVVSRVEADSPAQQAGIRAGDEILAADGIQIRSVYQAVRPILYKQPGDRMSFLVGRDGNTRRIEVVLGGGVELPSAPFENLGAYVRPKLDIDWDGQGPLVARSDSRTTREVSAPGSDIEPRVASSREKIRLLEKALDAYRNAIVSQQHQLHAYQQQQQEAERRIEKLTGELEELKRQLGR